VLVVATAAGVAAGIVIVLPFVYLAVKAAKD
jgi:hypothetical protein